MQQGSSKEQKAISIVNILILSTDRIIQKDNFFNIKKNFEKVNYINSEVKNILDKR